MSTLFNMCMRYPTPFSQLVGILSWTGISTGHGANSTSSSQSTASPHSLSVTPYESPNSEEELELAGMSEQNYASPNFANDKSSAIGVDQYLEKQLTGYLSRSAAPSVKSD